MNIDVVIRKEAEADVEAIRDVTIAAFKTLEISNHTEHLIIDALRTAGALVISLVAELNGKVVGHIAFSPIIISNGAAGWYGLGPVSVLPELHRQGIGAALIHEGISQLKDINAAGCCVVGHPEYYKKFEFRNSSNLTLEGVPPEVFFALSFDGDIPSGQVTFHKAFQLDDI